MQVPPKAPIAYTDINELQDKMETMDEASQRRFMRRLTMETHVTLHQHMADEGKYKKKLDEVHEALFHPTDGLINVRKWLCMIFRWICYAGGVAVTAAAGIASFGHSVGWW